MDLEAQPLIKAKAAAVPPALPPSLDTAWAQGMEGTNSQLQLGAPLPPLLQSGGMKGLERTGSGTEGYLSKAGDICMPSNASDPPISIGGPAVGCRTEARLGQSRHSWA